MLSNFGVKYVILGHSERRELGESNILINKKIKGALSFGLTPILCVGDKERDENHEYFNFVKNQIEECLDGIKKEQLSKIIIAYEPIWAIGTGVTASTEQAQDTLAFIRTIIAEKFGKEVAEGTSILYGGSCNAKNAPELFAQPDIDGGLIGGASLKVADFKAIIDAF